jgi:hypothetical protein
VSGGRLQAPLPCASDCVSEGGSRGRERPEVPHPEGIIGRMSAGGRGDLPQLQRGDRAGLWPTEPAQRAEDTGRQCSWPVDDLRVHIVKCRSGIERDSGSRDGCAWSHRKRLGQKGPEKAPVRGSGVHRQEVTQLERRRMSMIGSSHLALLDRIDRLERVQDARGCSPRRRCCRRPSFFAAVFCSFSCQHVPPLSAAPLLLSSSSALSHPALPCIPHSLLICSPSDDDYTWCFSTPTAWTAASAG